MPTRKQTFLDRISIALDWINPIVETDNPNFNISSNAAIMRNAELWLSSRYVEGFDPDDFPELSDLQRQELASALEAFKNIATAVPNFGPASHEQSGSGLTRLLEIHAILKTTLLEHHTKSK